MRDREREEEVEVMEKLGGTVTPVEEFGEKGINTKEDKIAIHIGPNIS